MTVAPPGSRHGGGAGSFPAGKQDVPDLVLAPARSVLAGWRVQQAREALAHCHLCAHHCGVNRLAGERGVCKAGSRGRIFSAQIEVSDELELIPCFSIALSGCDLRCDFCITGGESWNARAGDALSPEDLAGRAQAALNDGVRSIMILGGEPTIHLPTALEIVSLLPDDAKLIWKTNAHGTAQSRALLEGLFDVWLADFKFGNDACAQRLARVPDYLGIVQENLLWMSAPSAIRHPPSELIVRHLLMPGHVECCWLPVARWLAENLPLTKVNLRSGFWPAWHSARHPELRAVVPAAEAERALEIARTFSLVLIR